MQVGRSQDRNLAAILAQNAQYNRTMARDAAIDAKIAALTPAEISAVLKKRIDKRKIDFRRQRIVSGLASAQRETHFPGTVSKPKKPKMPLCNMT